MAWLSGASFYLEDGGERTTSVHLFEVDVVSKVAVHLEGRHVDHWDLKNCANLVDIFGLMA
jgi:hypothetical protein